MKQGKAAVEIEITIKTRGRGRKKQEPKVPLPPSIPRVTRLMALAIKFQDMIDRGEVRDFADIARLGYVTRARMTQIMNLLLLAPDLQERLLSATSETLSKERTLRNVVRIPDWPEQRKLFR